MASSSPLPRVTVAVSARNDGESTARCLGALRATLREDDQVLVVNHGADDLSDALVALHPWAQVVTDDVRQGFAKRANHAAAAAKGEIIVFLDDDTIVSPGWIDDLLEPFSDLDVGAVGARSNVGSGLQKIEDVSDAFSPFANNDRFLSSWREAHRGQTSEVAHLGGFCLAVSADVFREIGGFDEEYELERFGFDDLSMKIRTYGRRLLVAHGSFVFREANTTRDANEERRERQDQEHFLERWGSPTVPPLRLLSVCLIVKDEEELLGECLESVSGIADEIVVYDTGSTDRTVEIARSMGARVIEGYWDDSFARARNAALAAACGTWVFTLDADERLLGNFEALRAQLADQRSNVEAYLVAIENLHGTGNARSVHTTIRLYRRTRCTWQYRLHEQVVAKDDSSRALTVGYLSGVRIIHHGYSAEIFEGKNKADRNLALAEAALNDEELNPAYTLMNYGRALESAGRSDDAVAALVSVTAMKTDRSTMRLAIKNLIFILSRMERFDEALEHIAELRRISVSQIAADISEGRVLLSKGDVESGLAMLARVPPRGRDDDGMEYTSHTISAIRAEALASLGRYAEASDLVLGTVREEGVLEADLGELVGWLHKADRSASEIAAALMIEDLLPVLGRLLRQPPSVADEILEGIWERFPDRLEPLAAAGRVAPRLPIARALLWSSRLRGQGLASECPLVVIATNESEDPRVRVLACAAAYGSFGDRRVVAAAHQARSLLDPDSLEATTAEIGRLAPGLLEASPLDANPAPSGDCQASTSASASRSGESRASSLTAATSLAPRLEHGQRSSRHRAARTVASLVSRGGVNIVGPFEGVSSYAVVARRLATMLARSGAAVSTTSYHADGRLGPVPWTHYGEGDHPFETTLLVVGPEDMTNFVIDHGVEVFEGRYMIGVWLWDYEDPSEIMATSAKMVHEIWVPSDLSARAVTKSTDRSVIRVPIPPSSTTRSAPPRIVELGFDDSFTFFTSLDYDTGFERQNPLGVVEAFRRAFRPGEGPRLVIGTSNADHYPLEHARLVEACSDRDITVLSDDHVTSGWLFDRGGDAACYVSLHRSEGTGRFLSRAMTLGVATIVSQHSYGEEFFGPRDSFQVSCSTVPIPKEMVRGLTQSTWADPDLDEAASAMRLVVEQPKVAKVRARRAKDRARRQFGSPHAVKIMTDRLSAVESARHRIISDAPQLVNETR